MVLKGFKGLDFKKVAVSSHSQSGHSSDNKRVLGSSRKLEEAAEHLINGSEKRICRLTFEV